MAPPDVSSTSGVPAGYGRSCVNCSRAKCRCILRPRANSCERCHRLGKECLPMVTSRKRSAKKSTSSRTAQLEEKLDDLVSILRASQQTGQPPGQAQVPASSIQTVPSCFSTPSLPSRLDSLATAAATTPIRIQSDLYCSGASMNGNPSSSSNIQLDLPSAEAEALLHKFRSWLTKFPFMHIPTDLSGEALRKEKPFLWACIVNVTSMSLAQQRALRDQIRREVAQKIIIDHERTMDILLGLISFVAWASVNTGPRTQPFIIMYTQLATTILQDLGLNRPPNEEYHASIWFRAWRGQPPPPTRVRTTEERRAILSLWFCTSTASNFMGKMETLVWTPHMQDCLEDLTMSPEVSQDLTLAAMVRVQLVGEEAHKLFMRDAKQYSSSETPTYVFKKGLTLKLKEIRMQFAEQICSNYTLRAHLQSVEAETHAIGLFSDSSNREPETSRIGSVYSSLKAIRSWYDGFFELPGHELAGQPFHAYIGLSNIQSILYRITTLEDPAWDKEILRETVNPLVMFDKTIEKFRQVAAEYAQITDQEDECGIFEKSVGYLRNMKNAWEPYLAPHLKSPPTPSSQITGDSGVHSQSPLVGDNAGLVDATGADFSDLAWMTDVFGPWEF